MIENYLAPENVLFAIALALFLLIFLVQLMSVLIGLEPFSFLDNLIPGADVDFDVPDPGSVGFVDSVLSMLKIGKVPFVFSFILFLFLFSLVGLYGQLLLVRMGMPRLHWALASPIALALTLPLLRFGNMALGKLLPKDETYSVSSDTFVGRAATVTLGTATSDCAAEAKLVGPKGRSHYIRVVADAPGETFSQGDHVLVVSKRGEGVFSVIENELI